MVWTRIFLSWGLILALIVYSKWVTSIMLAAFCYEWQYPNRQIACWTIIDIFWRSELNVNHREVYYDIWRLKLLTICFFKVSKLKLICPLFWILKCPKYIKNDFKIKRSVWCCDSMCNKLVRYELEKRSWIYLFIFKWCSESFILDLKFLYFDLTKLYK